MRHEILLTDMLPETRTGFSTRKRKCETEIPNLDLNLKSNMEYLMAGEVDQSLGLWVNSIGQQHILPKMPYPSKEHPKGYYFKVKEGRVLDEYQLVYITEGEGNFSLKKGERGG